MNNHVFIVVCFLATDLTAARIFLGTKAAENVLVKAEELLIVSF